MTIPAAAISAIQAVNTDEVFLVLMTITFSATDVQHIVSNTENIVSRGVTYQAWPFSLTLPNQLETTTSSATLTFDNVDPAIWQALRDVNGIPSVLIEIVTASDPNTVILRCANLKLRNAQATTKTVTAQIYVDSIWQIGYPAHDYTPGEYPGLFSGS